MIEKHTLQFLKNIAKNNNKPWFEDNKPTFKKAQENIKAFIHELEVEMNKIDVISKSKVFRIYRDVRFSKDKTPYKTYFHAYLERAEASRRGGYFIGIEPGKSVVGGGFYGPEKDDLFRIRKELESDPDGLKKILESDNFRNHFSSLRGDGVKVAPKGFDKTHPNIELIRKKQFFAMEEFTDQEILQPDFVNKATETLSALRPFFDYMSDVLTTNLNGESIL